MTLERIPHVKIASSLCALVLLLLPRAALAEPDYEVRVLQVWVGGTPHENGPPKELKPHLEELRKRTGKKIFRLAKKPQSRRLKRGETLTIELPSGYRAEWTLEKGGLRQTLTNPQKKRSTLLFKRSPVFTGLKKIRSGEKTFQLVVEFRPRQEGVSDR